MKLIVGRDSRIDMVPFYRKILLSIIFCVGALFTIFMMHLLTGSMAEAGQRIRLGDGVYTPVRKSLSLPHRKALADFHKHQVAALNKEMAKINCDNDDDGKNHFNVELLTPRITADIRSVPGSYDVDEQLGLRVVSSQPGWKMVIHSTPLIIRGKPAGGGAHKIASDEVCLKTGDDTYVSLDHPVCLVSNGPVTEDNFYFDLSLVTKSFHRPGIYTGHLHLNVMRPPAQNGKETAPVCLPALLIPFEVEVTSHCLNEITGNKIYFHVGNPLSKDRSLSGAVQGHLESDAPVSLNLAVEDGRIDQLPMVQPIFPNKKYKETPWIPLTWKLSEHGACFRSPDAMANKRAVSWIIHGTPGVVDYKLDCAIDPAAYQEAGEYGTSVTITIKPLL